MRQPPREVESLKSPLKDLCLREERKKRIEGRHNKQRREKLYFICSLRGDTGKIW